MALNQNFNGLAAKVGIWLLCIEIVMASVGFFFSLCFSRLLTPCYAMLPLQTLYLCFSGRTALGWASLWTQTLRMLSDLKTQWRGLLPDCRAKSGGCTNLGKPTNGPIAKCLRSAAGGGLTVYLCTQPVVPWEGSQLSFSPHPVIRTTHTWSWYLCVIPNCSIM